MTHPPVHVISLDDAAHRWEVVERQMAAQSLTAQRFSAFDGRVGGFIAHGYAPHGQVADASRWEIKPSEQAVFASHQALWRKLAEGPDAAGVICEDDILISRGFAACLSKIDPQAAGVIKLDGFDQARNYGPLLDQDGWARRQILLPVPSAACYMLTRAAAQQLCKDSAAFCDTLDDFLFRARPGITPMQLWPAIAVQEVCVQSGPADSLREATDAQHVIKAARGPLWFRLRKELRRAARRRALRQAGPVVAPPLMRDLPPYRKYGGVTNSNRPQLS